VSVIRRGGEHCCRSSKARLDIARIEGGKLTLDVKPMRFLSACTDRRMFELQARQRLELSA